MKIDPNEVKKQVFESQVWRSIFRHSYQDNPRNRVLQVASNVWLHLHPVKMQRHAIRLSYTWCAGGLTFFFFLVTVATGVILMFYYRPVGEYAFPDIQYLEFDIPFGMLMRNMHRWAAHGMVILVWVHMFRVFMTGSYKPPREFNWVVGVLLLTTTLLLSFTGYLLPWDQLSIWAVTVGTNMARATPKVRSRSRSRRSRASSRRVTTRGRCSLRARRSALRRCCASTCSTASASRFSDRS
jgi:quinol-cytochrome oxidoreductase complex cytochrome b subunit